MNHQQHNGSRRGSLPSIPSNLRIRRPRSESYSATIGGQDLPRDEEGNRDIFDQARPDARSARRGLPRRRSNRQLGAVEALVMSDRIAANSRNLTSNSQSGADGERETSGPATKRPYLQSRVSRANALPALTEVSSPIERAADHPPGSKSGVVQRDYLGVVDDKGSQQPGPSALGEKSTTFETPSNFRPKMVSTASAPPEELPQPLEGVPTAVSSDDTDAHATRQRLERIMSGSDMPTPMSDQHDVMSEDSEHHAAEVADYLDVIDAEVGTLGYLTNVQNSIFVPHIPMLYDRRPIHDLPRTRKRGATISSLANRTHKRSSVVESDGEASHDHRSVTSDLEQARPNSATGAAARPKATRPASMLTRISSYMPMPARKTEEKFELEQHIAEWKYMDDEERNELDEHVKLVLSKKSKLKRGAKGFWAFVKTPMGFIMTLYGFLITFWGTAIMLFIFSWIKVGERRRYWIEICDQILCALFACVGLGFAPFRAVDTYRMIWIAKMHYRTWERRKALGLGKLLDPNDLPRPEDDRSNQVSRITSQVTPSQATPSRMNTGSVFADASTDTEANQQSSSSDIDVERDAGQLKASTTARRKHWWNLRKNKEAKDMSKKRLLEQEKAYTASNKRKGPLIVPEQRDADKNMTGKTNDLSRDGKYERPPIKRNDSIKSELVKEHEDIVVLTKEEQALLEHHQRKFYASHTFYRFHETATHRAFPLDLMIAIVCLLDCHSLLQGALGGCTWGIKYTHRPTALTATLITCSLSCNAMAGLLIYIGGRKTKKREEVERRLRIALEAMALAKINRRRARGELPLRLQSKESIEEKDNARKGSDMSGDLSDEQRQEELGEAVDLAARATEEEEREEKEAEARSSRGSSPTHARSQPNSASRTNASIGGGLAADVLHGATQGLG